MTHQQQLKYLNFPSLFDFPKYDRIVTEGSYDFYNLLPDAISNNIFQICILVNNLNELDSLKCTRSVGDFYMLLSTGADIKN